MAGAPFFVEAGGRSQPQHGVVLTEMHAYPGPLSGLERGHSEVLSDTRAAGSRDPLTTLFLSR